MRSSIFLMLCLIACSVNAEPFIAIGDSITAAHDSWANVIRDRGTRVRILAQNGRTIRDYEMPRDLKADRNYRQVVYFMGANDIMQATPAKTVKRAFRAHMLLLRDRGFKVKVIIPPKIPEWEGHSFTVRQILINQCQKMRLRCQDIDSVWNYSLTVDTVHPTTAGHLVLADLIFPQGP